MTGKLIALLGLPGSGKTEAVEYLMGRYGWPKVYFGQITLDEVAKRGLPLTSENERLVRESLRDEHGEEYYAREIVRRIEEHPESPVLLVESLYSFPEYLVLRERFGRRLETITIHASPQTRVKRLSSRPVRPLTEEEARSRDLAQLKRFEQGSPIALSDRVIVNEGTREELHKALDTLVAELGLAK